MSRRLLIASFESEQSILEATRSSREKGHTIVDVYTPFAVHGMDEAMGVKPSKLPWICFALGLSGAAAKFWFQMWTSATSWPVIVGGKPLRSAPAFVPVTFEIMVLFAGVGTVLAFLLISKLRPAKIAQPLYDRASNDRFVLVLEEHDAAFDVDEVRARFETLGMVSMEERIEERESE